MKNDPILFVAQERCYRRGEGTRASAQGWCSCCDHNRGPWAGGTAEVEASWSLGLLRPQRGLRCGKREAWSDPSETNEIAPANAHPEPTNEGLCPGSL